jgi:hypothetical protein
LTARLACHCLLVETGDELVLVDTGFGSGQAAAVLHYGLKYPMRSAMAEIPGVPISVLHLPRMLKRSWYYRRVAPLVPSLLAGGLKGRWDGARATSSRLLKRNPNTEARARVSIKTSK